jgi:hypothetical protein
MGTSGARTMKGREKEIGKKTDGWTYLSTVMLL